MSSMKARCAFSLSKMHGLLQGLGTRIERKKYLDRIYKMNRIDKSIEHYLESAVNNPVNPVYPVKNRRIGRGYG